MSYSEGELYYDQIERRWRINGKELHCGDVFQACPNGNWKSVRMEYSYVAKKYYTIPHIYLKNGVQARFR